MEKRNVNLSIEPHSEPPSLTELFAQFSDVVRLEILPDGTQIVRLGEDENARAKVIETLFGTPPASNNTPPRRFPVKRRGKRRRTWDEKGEIPPWRKR